MPSQVFTVAELTDLVFADVIKNPDVYERCLLSNQANSQALKVRLNQHIRRLNKKWNVPNNAIPEDKFTEYYDACIIYLMKNGIHIPKQTQYNRQVYAVNTNYEGKTHAETLWLRLQDYQCQHPEFDLRDDLNQLLALRRVMRKPHNTSQETYYAFTDLITDIDCPKTSAVFNAAMLEVIENSLTPQTFDNIEERLFVDTTDENEPYLNYR